MGNIPYPKTGSGPAVPATDADLARDAIGYTNPNLHRRIDPQEPLPESEELAPREYVLAIQTVNSYRTMRINYHDENSQTTEIP